MNDLAKEAENQIIILEYIKSSSSVFYICSFKWDMNMINNFEGFEGCLSL